MRIIFAFRLERQTPEEKQGFGASKIFILLVFLKVFRLSGVTLGHSTQWNAFRFSPGSISVENLIDRDSHTLQFFFETGLRYLSSLEKS